MKKDVWKFKRFTPTVRLMNIYANNFIVLLNEREAQTYDIYAGSRVLVRYKGKEIVAVVDVGGDNIIKKGEIGVFRSVAEALELEDNVKVQVIHMPWPKSLNYIRKKMDNQNLNKKEIKEIINDVMSNKLSEAELGAWVSATYINGLSEEEVVGLTEAIVESGEQLHIGKPIIADKHCIGGVANNRTTMIIVPILAALNVYIPKTSSRAITSAAGTADTMEVLADVDFSINELKEIVLKTHGAIVWGGGLNLASADDKLIKVRRPLHLDPAGMLLASILAKKKAVEANRVLIDIPVGLGAKITDLEKAKMLAEQFIRIGRRLKMKIEAIITDGSEPIGRGVGPILEARDVLEVLNNRGPVDLKNKGLMMAGKLLEMVGKAKKGEGFALAKRTLESGKALAKMREIIEMQGGDPTVRVEDLLPGEYRYDVEAQKDGRISHIDNRKLSQIARIAGSPMDKGAGVYLWKKKGDRVKKGDKLFTIYAESATKLNYAVKALQYSFPIEMKNVLLMVVDDHE